MENGDSAHSEHTHRSSNNAGHDFVHGTWTVQFLRKPHPRPLPKKGGAFLSLISIFAINMTRTWGLVKTGDICFNSNPLSFFRQQVSSQVYLLLMFEILHPYQSQNSDEIFCHAYP